MTMMMNKTIIIDDNVNVSVPAVDDDGDMNNYFFV